MEEKSISRDLESLSVSKRFMRNVTHKLKRKNHKDEEDTKGVSVKCLTLYTRGGGCKVGVEEEIGDPGNRRRSSACDEGKRFSSMCGHNDESEASMDCFSYARKEIFGRKNNRKLLTLTQVQHTSSMNVFLPDDIVEMCLVKLPIASLMNARLVCKKWRNLSITPRFMEMRREGLYQSPWLFLFGVVKDSICSGEIHALDISLTKWYKIDSEILKGRFLFSVASTRDDVYIVGGCTSVNNFGKIDRSSFKTHKEVFVFSPLTKTFRKVASMKYARSSPILGIAEVTHDCLINTRIEKRSYRTRIGGVSEVYEDPHRLSVRRQFDNDVSVLPNKFTKQRNGKQNRDNKKFVLIAVGGVGSWDEPLDSAEIFDSVTNKWTEIQRLPLDFGVACSGVVCKEKLYVYSESDKICEYDIEKGYWVIIETTPFPPRVHEYYPKLISCSERLFMLSVSWCDEGDGQIGRRNKAIRKLWELDLICLTWNEISTHPDAPMDWNATFVGDKNLIFGVEMFKIFGQVLDFLTMFDVSVKEPSWSHVSRNNIAAHELDASSCLTKSMAVLHL